MNTPKFANRLVRETSPYLLQHAYNPVEWFPWGEEAFEKAAREDKPVFISIGYSACHWCHVMEHESFENADIANLMNENFVNIKIDLEERPDIDQIYMTFVQMTTGHGGYPLNVFLTPDKLPFFGGTYFPPAPRYQMPSFPQILQSVAEAFCERRDELLDSANEILDEIHQIGTGKTVEADLTKDYLDTAFQSFVKSFDSINGGFGSAPKFPPPMSLEFLLSYYQRTKNKNALEMVEKTGQKMAAGGIFDQLGGGFHRYTVDAIWVVPHFEKMLYDNAQLARIYLHLFQATKNEFYKTVAVETLEYVSREMLDPEGGFYTAQDADSEGVEGKFFVWTPEEISGILGEPDARIFNFHFDVTEHGNFEEKNILNTNRSIDKTAQSFKIPENELKEIIRRGREKLFAAREKRVKPFRDEKVITAWNGLMLATFAEASAILDRPDYLEIARKNADFILGNLQKDGYLLRTSKDGQSKLNAYLEDYANFADGLTELFQVSGDVKYLREAKRLADLMITEFWDETDEGFFFTANNHEKLPVRSKDFYDNAVPSGNSVVAALFLKLSHLLADEKYEQFAVRILRRVASQIRLYPQAFGRILQVLEFYLNPVKEIVIIGTESSELEREVWNDYLPNKIVILAENAGDNAEFIPLLEGRKMIDKAPTAFVCENFTCQKPVNTVEELRRQLA